ncbi:MAG: hypothetical protein ACW9W4_07790 [Candidatus Nitrosopumilus sp. bin_7KS]
MATCNQEIQKSETTYQKTVNKPVFRNNVLVDLTPSTIVDYDKLIHALKNKIKKYPEMNSLFKIIKNILKTNITKIESKNKYKLDIDYEELTNEQLFNFILQYLKEHGSNFDNLKFKKNLENFNQYITTDFFSHCYLSPLYNVDGNFKEIQLSPNLWIRKITRFEFAKIVNIDNLPLKEIPPHQKRLNYVLVCKIIRKKNLKIIPTALEYFEHVANSLKLFKFGNPQFGNLYWFSSQNWNVDGLNLVEKGHERPASSQKYVLNSKLAKEFVPFFENINEKFSNLDNSNFLESAIRRFGMSFNHRKAVDTIVDYVICLESLLVPNIGDSTLKLSHRMASLLGETDDERLWIWYFVKTAYKFRSGYLHETKERTFSVNSEIIDLETVANKLEEFSKKSILRMIDLLDFYPTQKKIIEELDESIYDRKKLDLLKNKLKH